MKKLRYTILSLLLISAYGNSQVTVSLRQPPLYQFKVEDFWKVTLNNTTQNIYNVYLYGIATSTQDGKIVDANTKTFALKPGLTVIKGSDVSPVQIKEKNKKYEDAIKYTGGLPTGDYDICLTVYNADNNEVLGTECLSHSVEIISGIELLLPENKSNVISGNGIENVGSTKDIPKTKIKVDVDIVDNAGKRKIKIDDYMDVSKPKNFVSGSFITFSWLAPSPALRGGKITYSLTITEMLLNQSAYDALQSNPEFFRVTGLFSTVYQYPFMARDFKSGRRYAWKITAFFNGVKMTESEVNEFEYTGWKPPPEKEEIAEDLDISYFNQNKLTSASLYSLHDLRCVRKKSVPLFKLSVNGSIYGENSNRQGTGSDIPQRYMNFELTPTLSIYGLPFSLPILLSTQNQDNKQSINSFAFSFDPSSLKDLIQQRVEKEIGKVKDEIEQRVNEKGEKFRGQIEGKAEEKAKSKLPGIVKFFSYFHTLGFGTTYPSYTKHTIDGVPVTGANIEFNPGIVYVAGTLFKNQKAIDNVSYRRDMYAGRLGVGKKDKSHFIMTLMNVRDDENSMTIDTSKLTDKNVYPTPKANWLFGMDGKLNLFKDKLSLEAEGVLSMLTRDVRDPDIISEAIPQWVKNIFKPKGSSSADYMYGFKGTFTNEKTNTKVSAEMKMIGPGFTTLGNPSLRNDKLGFEGKVDQKFLERKISAGVSFRTYRDNLIQTKRTTTTTTSVIVKLGLNFRGYPTLNVMVMPNFQKNDKQVTTTDSSKMDNRIMLYNVVSSYSAKLGDITAQTTVLFSYNDSKTLFGLNDYWTKTSSLTETFIFKFPLSVSASIGMVQVLNQGVDYQRVITFNLAPTYTFKEIGNWGAGLAVDVDKDKNKKLGISLNSNVQLWKFLTFDLRAEQNFYTDWSNRANSYKEFILHSTLSAVW
jgi:hypothetical protein